MNKKFEILLVFLGILSLSGLGLATWIYFSSQAKIHQYVQEQNKLEKHNIQLQKKIDSAQEKLRTAKKESSHWKERAADIKVKLDKLSKENTLLQEQYATLLQERISLVEEKTALLKEKNILAKENKKLNEELEKLNSLYSQEQQEPTIDTADEFLSSILEEKAGLQIEVRNLKEQIELLEKESQPVQERLVQLEKERKQLEKRLDDAERVSSLLSDDLVQEKKQRAALEEDLARTLAQLKEIMFERDKFADQLADMQQALEQRLAKISRTQKVLASTVDNSSELVHKSGSASIKLSPIIVKAEQQTQGQYTKLAEPWVEDLTETELEPSFQLEGHIITINAKHKFVVINLGKDNNVEVGMDFDVYRDEQRIGQVKVIETRQNIAACDIKQIGVSRFKVNDIVRR
jgi:chromosome segregation ATPase